MNLHSFWKLSRRIETCHTCKLPGKLDFLHEDWKHEVWECCHRENLWSSDKAWVASKKKRVKKILNEVLTEMWKKKNCNQLLVLKNLEELMLQELNPYFCSQMTEEVILGRTAVWCSRYWVIQQMRMQRHEKRDHGEFGKREELLS